MKQKIGIYLAGSIKKGHENSDELFWTPDDMALIRNSLPEYEVVFLNPAIRMDNMADPRSVFGRDMTQVFCSHLVFVDARGKRGLGVGAEIMWAKLNKIPVITWAPVDSHYKKEKATILGIEVKPFIHPFVSELSDQIVDTLEEGAQWIKQSLCDPAFKIKGIEHMQAAMQHYQASQLSVDLPMWEILSCETFRERLTRPCEETKLK